MPIFFTSPIIRYSSSSTPASRDEFFFRGTQITSIEYKKAIFSELVGFSRWHPDEAYCIFDEKNVNTLLFGKTDFTNSLKIPFDTAKNTSRRFLDSLEHVLLDCEAEKQDILKQLGIGSEEDVETARRARDEEKKRLESLKNRAAEFYEAKIRSEAIISSKIASLANPAETMIKFFQARADALYRLYTKLTNIEPAAKKPKVLKDLAPLKFIDKDTRKEFMASKIVEGNVLLAPYCGAAEGGPTRTWQQELLIIMSETESSTCTPSASPVASPMNFEECAIAAEFLKVPVIYLEHIAQIYKK